MKIKNKTWLSLILLGISLTTFGQIKQFDYSRELGGVQDQWHKIVLPNDIFERVSPELSDLRIYGINKHNDTIEAPYILRAGKEEVIRKEVKFKLINQSRNEQGYYFTFEIPTENSVNQINLEFKQQNFDWRLNLEGSQNQQDWFSIVEDYRILSIRNESTDFQFTTINFPNSNYPYYRLLIKSDKKPDLLSPKIALNEIIDGNYRKYAIKSSRIEEEKKDKQSIISIDLKSAVPVSKLKLFVNDRFDYYRPISIEYLSDSFHSEKGWKYNYSTLTRGTLNSIEENEFKFSSTVLQKLKIIIENKDNKALQIDSISVDGFVYELIARFVDPGTYYLVYGNDQARWPDYDIARFEDKIPTNISPLTLGEEQSIEKVAIQKTEPLFKNKIWLWAIMVFIIILLGWFSLSMMRKK